MPKPSPWTCVLFDVDGTLVDSAPQVTRAFQLVLEREGLPVPESGALRRFVGPPLWHSFTELGYGDARLDTLVAGYREIYDTMFLDPLPFPGVLELVRSLHAAGRPIATATSKQQYMAAAQLAHLGVDGAFDVVAGASAGPGSTKATVIADALAQLADLGADVSRPVLVGDSIWDVEGASSAGVEVIGVSWGYAGPGELEGCAARADSVAELAALLGLDGEDGRPA